MKVAVILFVVVLHSNVLKNQSAIAHGDIDGDHHHGHRHHHEHAQQHQHQGTRLRSTSTSSLIALDGKNQSYPSEKYRRLNTDTIENCGSRNPTLAEFKDASRVVTKWITNQLLNLKQAQTVEIDTYFHIILNGGIDEDTPTTLELENQIIVLNDEFRPHGFSFRSMGTTYTDNINWYFAGSDSQDQTDMKTALRVGDASTLNVYLNRPTGSTSGTLLGYAVFPWSYQRNPNDDGIVLHDEVLPGGLFTRFQEGKTLIHEVGHWLGLFHTFQPDLGFFQNVNFILYLLRIRNGCNTAGDDVKDTPRSRSPNAGCPVGADTCKLRRGLDPINNFMEYTDDACRTEFTAGQSERMWAMWNEYRAP